MTVVHYESAWDAIENTPAEAENMKIRSALMLEIATYISDAGLTQTEAAQRFGVTQPRISDLNRGKINLFSVDALVNMLAVAGTQLDVHVRPWVDRESGLRSGARRSDRRRSPPRRRLRLAHRTTGSWAGAGPSPRLTGQ